MSQQDDVLIGGLSNVGKTAIKATKEKDNGPEKIFLFLSLLFVLVIVGAEGVKITLRTNFSSQGIRFWRMLLCAICLGGISYSYFSGYYFHANVAENQTTVFVTAALYALLSLFILTKGIIMWIRGRSSRLPQISLIMHLIA